MNTDGELTLCLLNNIEIEIRFQGTVDYVGNLLGFDHDSLQIHDGYYLRENCQVYLASKRSYRDSAMR